MDVAAAAVRKAFAELVRGLADGDRVPCTCGHSSLASRGRLDRMFHWEGAWGATNNTLSYTIYWPVSAPVEICSLGRIPTITTRSDMRYVRIWDVERVTRFRMRDATHGERRGKFDKGPNGC